MVTLVSVFSVDFYGSKLDNKLIIACYFELLAISSGFLLFKSVALVNTLPQSCSSKYSTMSKCDMLTAICSAVSI